MNPLLITAPTSAKWSALTHRGRRPNNEDSFLGMYFDGREVRLLGKRGELPLEASDLIFAVSDGLGGAQAGEFASRTAVARLTRMLNRHTRLAALNIETGFQDFLTEAIHGVHHDLVELSRAYTECAGMGATLTLLWLAPGKACFAHVGDSRLYLLRDGSEIRQLSEDHTHVGWLRRAGKLTEAEARRHPRRNVLQQALGANCALPDPTLGSLDIQSGDRFLLCTDGLTDGLSDPALEHIIRSPSAMIADMLPADRLIKESLQNAGSDNLTALVVELS